MHRWSVLPLSVSTLHLAASRTFALRSLPTAALQRTGDMDSRAQGIAELKGLVKETLERKGVLPKLQASIRAQVFGALVAAEVSGPRHALVRGRPMQAAAAAATTCVQTPAGCAAPGAL